MIASDPSGGTVRSQSAEITPHVSPPLKKKKRERKKGEWHESLTFFLDKKKKVNIYFSYANQIDVLRA